ncbi:toll-like receptor 13 [Ostrinia nubilalis]|uniref:toll-like receptor 13 n=1 Tax=Ostrinia nubilalis TaxID=29057 RepID=UPI0030823033
MTNGLLVPFLLWMLACLSGVACSIKRNQCLTGVMTDVQNWVTETGELTSSVDIKKSMDLSAVQNPTLTLQQQLAVVTRDRKEHVTYLSLARNSLTRVPPVFNGVLDSYGWDLAKSLEYLTLYGNRFIEVSSPGEQYDVSLNATGATEINTGMIHRGAIRAMWAAGFQWVTFTSLRELDLRSCGIETLDSFIFQNMPMLEALYLSGNIITYINSNSFAGLTNLVHLDLSRNHGPDDDNIVHLSIESDDVFASLENLRSLDLSHTMLNTRRISALRNLSESLERLSLCFVGAIRFDSGFFANTSLRYLDLSGNFAVLENAGVLQGLENRLQVLYASDIGLKSFDVFNRFRRLEILKLTNNEISDMQQTTARSLVDLQALDLRRNRLTNWQRPLFSLMPSLRFLDLRSNTVNVITEDMIRDLGRISFLALSDNPMVCNCHSKEFIELAAQNEAYSVKTLLRPMHASHRETLDKFGFHLGFVEVNDIISSRINISISVESLPEIAVKGNFVLVDYDKDSYSCLALSKSVTVPFGEGSGCKELRSDFEAQLESGRAHLLALLAIPGVLLPALIIGYTYRRNLRYCYVTMRNSAMLSMVNEQKIISDDTIFNYDVFVSYCNEDRPWVLDQLLSHLENDCSVSLCLHERDFQVGLSILENIVSCMDRSKAIMLVISKQFLLSQWCQFEMHLAQHRLLETRREDLILILLEDIPRRLRPNTLHYLMLTKTYIVWPKNKSEQQLFWKRLKKSVVTQRQKHEDKVSLA